ncbi:hypothetical protein [Gordonia tangerina]|uniref:Uncharacterized protein n=1 Tax=Gordonia tangerina TaxID=2911060 RepID=A0ABS9DDL7_9ACTN|nr:hypothetical protein [Gordonia tangerina]MCF3937187.1 hypothetical protein [Gordonia tangerina]
MSTTKNILVIPDEFEIEEVEWNGSIRKYISNWQELTDSRVNPPEGCSHRFAGEDVSMSFIWNLWATSWSFWITSKGRVLMTGRRGRWGDTTGNLNWIKEMLESKIAAVQPTGGGDDS